MAKYLTEFIGAFFLVHPPTDRPVMAVHESQSEQSRSVEEWIDTIRT